MIYTKKTIFLTCILFSLALSSSTHAGGVNEKINDLHTRLHKMETSAQNTTAITQIHGTVEVEYGYSEDYTKANSSDIVLATVELAIETTVNDNVNIAVSLLHEEDDTALELDVGVINIHDENSPLSLSLGQMYVPFGSFDSNMISDPLTLELGETRESALYLTYSAGNISAGVYAFNGDIEETAATEDKVRQVGVSIAFDNENFHAGIDYISAFSDSDAIQDFLAGPVTVVSQVAGISAHASYSIDANTFILEYVGATDKFDVTEMAYRGVGAKPSSINLEFAMELDVSGHDSTIAIGYQATDEAVALGLPQRRAMIAYSTELYADTTLGAEYLIDKDYEVSGGTGESGYTFTVQLATSF